jgi:predicted DNA-binding transcriptional regulator AlpA
VTAEAEERLRQWVEKTGKSRPTLYRRLKELDR